VTVFAWETHSYGIPQLPNTMQTFPPSQQNPAQVTGNAFKVID